MILGYGVDLATDRLAQGLSELGFDVTVYCSFADGSFSGGKYDIRAVPVPASVLITGYESRAEELIRPLEKEVDVWIVETYPFFKAAHRFKRPWIAIDYGVVPSKSFPLAARRRFDHIRRTQYGEYFQTASKIVCISEFLLQNLRPAIRRNALVVYPGIDHYSRRSLIDLRLDLGLDGVVILYQGRSSDTTPYKGVDILLDTYSKLRPELNATLVISTTCSLEEQTRLQLAGAKVLNGVLMPFMPSVYQCADLFATATQWEGFDLPLLEASYFRLPVVAFSVAPILKLYTMVRQVI
jgi:glycosyltransferase involved in cell wall biosynthesis